MILLAILLGLLLAAAAGVQLMISKRFQEHFDLLEPVTMPLPEQELALVVICVRGCDPSLESCLRGVLNQDYANYRVQMIVDHRSDQAWDFVQEIKSKYDDRNILTILEMQEPPDTCSLKCSGIVQALHNIDERTKYVAFLDADVAPHPQWLAELTGPLQDPEIGGVTGNQWFEPAAGSGIGSLLRSTWNAGALVPTIFFANPWAGSFAMRLQDIHDSGLEEIWAQSVVDDGPIKKAINDLGLRVEFAPSLIMTNRESCGFRFTNRWVTRMLTWSRLYEPTFYLSIIHAVFSNGVMLANFGVLLLALLSGSFVTALISATALIASGWMCARSYELTRQCAIKSCKLRGQTLAPLTKQRFWGIVLSVAMTHLIYGVSCLEAIFVHQIKWREVTYEVSSHNQIKRLDYAPYLPKTRRRDVSI